VSSIGEQGNGASQSPTIAADGGRVACKTTANNVYSRASGGPAERYVHVITPVAL
jgi:hypothetical protein